MPKIEPAIETFARIKVIGIGGSGKNALNHMINSKVKNVDFIAMNTDTQDLHNSLAEKKIHLGKNLTKGLGAGMNPAIGNAAAEETKSEIQDVIKGADMIFIACGMGGGTGTGAAPVVARAAKDAGILTVAVVTKPFFFEGKERMRLAEEGLQALKDEVDAIIVIPNDRLLQVAGKGASFKEAFAMCDDVLRQAVEGISDLITTPGIINVDFADIKSVMQNTGSALMGIGKASGDDRARIAATEAINSPLLELSITGAEGVLFAISGGEDLGIMEVQEAAQIITESVSPDARIIFGSIKDDRLSKGEIKITVIATGFPTNTVRKERLVYQPPQIVSEVQKKEETPTIIETEKNIPEAKEEKAQKHEIHNDFPNDFIQKKKEPETIIIDDFDDDTEDWSAVPAFLRRKK
jgi:cell division protein FtsZ